MWSECNWSNFKIRPGLSLGLKKIFKLNLDNYHLIVSGTEMQKLNCKNCKLKKKEKLVCIISDDRLKFHHNIENLYKNASLKLSAFLRVATLVDLPQKKNLFNVFFR